jgi:hypothetical protein
MIGPKQKMMHKATPSREETTTKIQTLLLILGPVMMRIHVYHEMALFFWCFRSPSKYLKYLFQCLNYCVLFNEFNKTNTHLGKADQILCCFVFR